MRSHGLKLRGHHPQTRFIPSRCASPIPVWGRDECNTNTCNTEKLRQFCFQHPVTFSTSPKLRTFPNWIRTPIRAIAFLSIGTCVGLSAPTSPSPLALNRGLGFIDSPSGTLDVEAARHSLQWLNLWGLKSNKEATSRVAFVGIAQEKLKWIYPGRLTSPGLMPPVADYPITSKFGNRIHPIFGDTQLHHGIDIGTPVGTPVQSSAAGSVSYAGWDGGYGKTIVIQHGDGYETLYAHLDQLQVKVGDRVSRGEIIGLSGGTGSVTGPHLHFEIRLHKVAYNPIDYF